MHPAGRKAIISSRHAAFTSTEENQAVIFLQFVINRYIFTFTESRKCKILHNEVFDPCTFNPVFHFAG
jgi:hypothetical protein